MSLKRLRYRDLVALGIVGTRPTLQSWIRHRGFPPGQLTGPNSRTWGEDEVCNWLAMRPTKPKAAPPPPAPDKRPRGRPRRAPQARGAA